MPAVCFERAAAETDALWRDAGLSPEPLGGVFRGTYVGICPPRLQTEAVPTGVSVEYLRPTAPADPGESLPQWFSRLPDRATRSSSSPRAGNDTDNEQTGPTRTGSVLVGRAGCNARAR